MFLSLFFPLKPLGVNSKRPLNQNCLLKVYDVLLVSTCLWIVLNTFSRAMKANNKTCWDLTGKRKPLIELPLLPYSLYTQLLWRPIFIVPPFVTFNCYVCIFFFSFYANIVISKCKFEIKWSEVKFCDFGVKIPCYHWIYFLASINELSFFFLMVFLMLKPVKCDNGSVRSLFWSLWLVLQLMYAFKIWTKFITWYSDLLTVQENTWVLDYSSLTNFQAPTFYGFTVQERHLGCCENAWITPLMAPVIYYLFFHYVMIRFSCSLNFLRGFMHCAGNFIFHGKYSLFSVFRFDQKLFKKTSR